MKKAGLNMLKLSVLFVFIGVLSVRNLSAQANEDCLMCHEDPGLTMERFGKEVSVYVDTVVFNKYIHKNVDCISCHTDAADEGFAHADQSLKLKVVDCGICHTEAKQKFNRGIHGRALRENRKYAPTCTECHGQHDILSNGNPSSRTYKMNIPVLCGKCHREGGAVARYYNVSEHNILENYSQSIHGKGLYSSGLIVTATCNDCHGNHLILPHTNRNSSISVYNVAKTCMKCHARIEDVHKKVINNELWEKEPGAIPACSDCHPPHKLSPQNLVERISDRSCLKCHENKNISKTVDGRDVSLYVDVNELANSMHKSIKCVKCHSDVTPKLHRPCETAQKIDCSNCHVEVSEKYFESGHGQAYFRKVEEAPYCTECHGTHGIKSKDDETARIFRSNIPKLCGDCHQKDGKATEVGGLKEINAFADYSTSVHGMALKEKGLLSAAVCTDCHTTHFNFKESDERSSVHPSNVPATCAKCHKGIYDQYIESDHSIFKNDDDKEYPNCVTCHTAHVISEIDQDKFMTEINLQCGSCHTELAETYLDTYHGKAYQLGYLEAARCSDCHGSHKIYSANNPKSMVSMNNIVETCKQCHEDANARFTGYFTHATHSNRQKYPVLYYSFWAMTSLLIAVFAFFGIHTLLWLPRSLKERKKKRHKKPKGEGYYIRRFSKSQRITHIFVMLSFILLALTGMMLKFANMEWAKLFARAIGGAYVAGVIHRLAAVITFGYFVYHVVSLLKDKRKRGIKFGSFIFSSKSLMFNRQDLKDFWATIKWFVGKGPRPGYGRWTYWEKFDYLAVFWGVAIIGFTGLILWFPEFFTILFPGWLINVAQIIHSDEALLAVGFIFTIHFFNTHFRPEAFPMDTVIFTGHYPAEEYKEERPREYEELEKSGKLKDVLVKREIAGSWLKMVKFFGFTVLAIGFLLVILIIYSMLFGYN